MKTQPTQPAERIVSLDVLRGFAILGILIMNIQSFSMPEPACLNPTAYGNFQGINMNLPVGIFKGLDEKIPVWPV